MVVGQNRTVELFDGRGVNVTGLNNAATTPLFTATLNALTRFYETYGALHRGAGPNARATCEAVEIAIESIRYFIGARADHELLFTSNASEAINLGARLLRTFTKNRYIITSDIEHTSNNLPWRTHSQARILEISSDMDGKIDLQHLEDLLERYGSSVALVTITGASNLTGYIPPIEKIARLTRKHGALLFVDGAQLIPHRPFDMERLGVDLLAFSAHKVYAPAGIGVLAIPRNLLQQVPVNPGGGSIDMYSAKGKIIWAAESQRHQVGTANAAGIFALGTSLRQLLKIGWDHIVTREASLLGYLLQEMSEIPGIELHAAGTPIQERTSVVAFSVKNQHHALVAAILEAEYGIEVRAGTICNHRLVRRWLNLGEEQQKQIEIKIAGGNRLASYGVVRASLGVQTTMDDVLRLLSALHSIASHGPTLRYQALEGEERFEALVP